MQAMRYAAVAALVLAAGCGGGSPESGTATGPAGEPVVVQGTRAYFVIPDDGAVVTSPVRLEFGSQGVAIAAVPAEPGDTARPGLGHYHVGVGSPCLESGVSIPRTDAWTHLDSGDTVAELVLPEGEHALTLLVGDDLERAIEGLCTTITVNVEG